MSVSETMCSTPVSEIRRWLIWFQRKEDRRKNEVDLLRHLFAGLSWQIYLLRKCWGSDEKLTYDDVLLPMKEPESKKPDDDDEELVDLTPVEVDEEADREAREKASEESFQFWSKALGLVDETGKLIVRPLPPKKDGNGPPEDHSPVDGGRDPVQPGDGQRLGPDG